MNHNETTPRKSLEPEEVLVASLVIFVLIILVSIALYLTASSGGPVDPRGTFYVIACIATISVLVAALVALGTREAMFLFYAVFPYALLILGGAVYYMVLLSSVDALGVFCVISGHWAVALMLWIFKQEITETEKKKPSGKGPTSTPNNLI